MERRNFTTTPHECLKGGPPFEEEVSEGDVKEQIDIKDWGHFSANIFMENVYEE